jgi:cytoskeletal protein CcmA (bactofilin family)
MIFLLAGVLIFVGARTQAAERLDLAPAGSPQTSGQIFYDNLTVAEGDVYEGDVTVTAGNVLVEDGGLIEGNLIVWSGNVVIQLGGEVEGDVSALSGNVTIAGDVGGSVAAVSGNIELLETATVDGDVSVISGDVLRAPEAEIDGNVIKGATPKLPMPFSGWIWGDDQPSAPVAPAAPVMATGSSFWGWLGWTVLRMVLAVMFTAIIVTLVCVLYNLRPDLIRPLAPLVRERSAYVFVVGLMVNLVLLVLTGALFFTLCLAVLGLAPGFVLVVLNLIGWTLASQLIGERLATYIKTPMEPIAKVAIGAIVATGGVMSLWALGGCFRPMAHLLWLLISSFGVGAVVVHWLRLDRPAPPPPQAGESEPLTPAEPTGG